MAKTIPGKEEFHETIRYFRRQLELHNVTVKLNHEASVQELVPFDEVVVATGVVPRQATFPGHDDPRCLSYIDVLRGKAPVGKRVALVGAGGIGFDVAEFLSHDPSHTPSSIDIPAFFRE